MHESIEEDGGHVNGQVDVISEDLLILSTWVKKELFIKVKFIYNQEKDLRIKGGIYNLFVSTCKSRLIGMKVNAGKSEDFKENYMQALWSRATNKKKNIITDGLNIRRSGVYTLTQSRFTGTFLAEIHVMQKSKYNSTYVP